MTLRLVFAVLLISLGLLVTAISVLGLFRLHDALERLHAGALMDTLGLLLILAGLAVILGFSAHTLKLVVLLIIIWAANPVSSHLIARMELITGHDLEPGSLTGEGEMDL